MAIYPTTETAIIAHMIDVIRQLVPAANAGDPFRPKDTEDDENGDAFRKWCEDNPASAFRYFQVRRKGDRRSPTASSVDLEERELTVEIIVAYPQTGRAGAGQALSRDAVVESDAFQIERATGMVGISNFTDPNPEASCLETVTDPRLEGAGVDFLVMRHRLIYVRQYT